MENSSQNSLHHSAVHIAQLVREGRAAADPHLSECPHCAEVAELLKVAAFRTAPAVSEAPVCHLADEQLVALLLESAPAGVEQHLGHVAWCGTCADRLQRLEGIFSNDPIDPPVMLRSSTAAWRRDMVKRIGDMSPRKPKLWPKYAAVAASVLVVAAIGYRTLSSNGPEELLAEAYTQSRPFDYRLPDKGYARVSQRMSGTSTFDKPKALIEAQARISSSLSDALVARGRAELLNGDPEAAIATLERARSAAPGIETFALDLACAYAARGDASRPDDYAMALDLLERLLQTRPDDKAALFNRALVFERLQRFEDAEQAWDRYLKTDSSGSWADEARQRKESASQKKSTVKKP